MAKNHQGHAGFRFRSFWVALSSASRARLVRATVISAGCHIGKWQRSLKPRRLATFAGSTPVPAAIFGNACLASACFKLYHYLMFQQVVRTARVWQAGGGSTLNRPPSRSSSMTITPTDLTPPCITCLLPQDSQIRGQRVEDQQLGKTVPRRKRSGITSQSSRSCFRQYSTGSASSSKPREKS